MGIYTIVYGKLQAASNAVCLTPLKCAPPRPSNVLPWTIILGMVSAIGGIAFYACKGISTSTSLTKEDVETSKLCISIVTPFFFVIFAVVMAVVSAVHSFLIVAYAGRDKVAKEVGFTTCQCRGRLVGTLLSGIVYEYTEKLWGISICLWVATGFLIISSICSHFLPQLIVDHDEEVGQKGAAQQQTLKN